MPSRTSYTSDTPHVSRTSPASEGSGTTDVLVVGGGIIGLVTAWRAARRGLATALVDPAPGGGAAQVAAGMLAAVTELHYGEETLLALNLESARRYPDFVAELTEASGRDLGYRRCGTLAVAHPPQAMLNGEPVRDSGQRVQPQRKNRRRK